MDGATSIYLPLSLAPDTTIVGSPPLLEPRVSGVGGCTFSTLPWVLCDNSTEMDGSGLSFKGLVDWFDGAFIKVRVFTMDKI